MVGSRLSAHSARTRPNGQSGEMSREGWENLISRILEEKRAAFLPVRPESSVITSCAREPATITLSTCKGYEGRRKRKRKAFILVLRHTLPTDCYILSYIKYMINMTELFYKKKIFNTIIFSIIFIMVLHI